MNIAEYEEYDSVITVHLAGGLISGSSCLILELGVCADAAGAFEGTGNMFFRSRHNGHCLKGTSCILPRGLRSQSSLRTRCTCKQIQMSIAAYLRTTHMRGFVVCVCALAAIIISGPCDHFF